MSVETNSDDEHYSNESFESPSETDEIDISEQIDKQSNLESDGEAKEKGEENAEEKEKLKMEDAAIEDNKFHTINPTSLKRLQSYNKRMNRPHMKKYLTHRDSKNRKCPSISSSDAYCNEDEYDDDDDDDGDVMIRKFSIKNLSTKSMNFETASMNLSDSMKMLKMRKDRKINLNKFSKTDLIELSENSEYTDDDDYHKIQELEKCYKQALLKNHRQYKLSEGKRQEKLLHIMPVKELNETEIPEEVLAQNDEEREDMENDQNQENEIEIENKIENDKQVKQDEQSEQSEQSEDGDGEESIKNDDDHIQTDIAGVTEMTSVENSDESFITKRENVAALVAEESDILVTSHMLQPGDNFVEELFKSEELTQTLVNAVKSTILKVANSSLLLNYESHSSKYATETSDDKELTESDDQQQKLFRNRKRTEESVEEEQRVQERKRKVGDGGTGDDGLCNDDTETEKTDTEEQQLKRMVELYKDSFDPFDPMYGGFERMPNYYPPLGRTLNLLLDDDDDDGESSYLEMRLRNCHKAPINNTPKIKPHPRKSWTFTNDRVREIERHNQILLRKILSQRSTKKPHNTTLSKKHQEEAQHGPMGTSAARITSSSLNRKKQQRQIDFENSILQKKLAAISLRRPVLP